MPTSIAILNASWSVHSSLGYMIACLTANGHAVDLFLYDSDESLSGDLIRPSPQLQIFRLGSERKAPQPSVLRPKRRSWRGAAGRMVPAGLRTGFRTLRRKLRIHLQPTRGLIDDTLIATVVEESKRKRYGAIMGIEKAGLVWAGAVAAKIGIPLVYYSLELYTWNHPRIIASDNEKYLKAAEEKFHRLCALTIIQDERRGRILSQDHGIGNAMKTAFLPISLAGPANRVPSSWLHDELGLDPRTVIILSYGRISQQRLCSELVQIAHRFRDDWRLVLHGYGPKEDLEAIRVADTSGRVHLSLKLVPAAERERIIRSAQIGLAFYDRHPINDQLTGFASEKIALYLQCGIPLIGFRYPSYEHIESEGAGVLVESMDEIPGAIQRILRDYTQFTEKAYACYERHYRFETNFDQVMKELTSLRVATETSPSSGR